MKKIYLRVLCILLSFSILAFVLCGCEPAQFHYKLDDLIANVDSIDLIYYVNYDCNFVNDEDQIQRFDFNSMITLQTLSRDKTEAFLQCLTKGDYLKFDMNFADSPKGHCIKLNHNNGDFDVLCIDFYFACQYYIDGTVKNYFGGVDNVHYLLSKYFREYASDVL